MPDATLLEALHVAARRGADVAIVVPDKSGEWLTDLARGSYLRDLAEAGAKVQMHKGMVHAKIVLIDDRLAMVGSANFDARSMFLNFEVMGLFYSPEEIGAVAAYVNDLLLACEPSSNSVSPRRDMLESIARLISPVL